MIIGVPFINVGHCYLFPRDAVKGSWLVYLLTTWS